MTPIFDQHLDKNPANFVALSPVGFLERTAQIFGDLAAIIKASATSCAVRLCTKQQNGTAIVPS